MNIVRKYILCDTNCSINYRDINLPNWRIFDSEEELKNSSTIDKYFAVDQQIVLIEGELYNNSLRDLKEVCGHRKRLMEIKSDKLKSLFG